ncbi:HEAT repeat domain-containing protein [Methylomonas sp. MS20]|uniref:HEAT repeat domain-containing protein n=1 Tax=Methylomonas sp. MS20 TaxID=3418769 RepID=UPI003CFC151D
MDRIVRLGPKSLALPSEQALSELTDLFSDSAEPDADGAGKVPDTSELLAVLEEQAARGLSYEDLLSGKELQQLSSRLQSDSAARGQVLEQFIKASGTPLGKALSQTLGMVGAANDMPELKATAVKLLQNGSAEQRFDALRMLGQTVSYDSKTRATVLDVLRRDATTDPELAIAAMANLNLQTPASKTEQQEIVKAVYPFIGSDDPQVRLSSLQALSQWVGDDQDAIQVFANAANDADPNVRRWVIAAMGNGEFAYDSVREPLLATLQNPDEDPAVKAVAQRALERFPLDEQAQQIYQEHLASESYQAPTGGFGFN